MPACSNIFRFIFCHLSATVPPLPGPSVSSVIEAMTARDAHPPQGPLVMGGEGMMRLGWGSRWIVCTVNFPHCHEVGAVIARGNINNNFPCTFYVSDSQECHANMNTGFICPVFDAEMCHKIYHGPSKSRFTAACFKRSPKWPLFFLFQENKTKIYLQNIALGGS